jgi:hypothetical protein
MNLFEELSEPILVDPVNKSMTDKYDLRAFTESTIPDLSVNKDTLRKEIFHSEPTILYVYRSTCYYCQIRAPIFVKETKGLVARIFRFNALDSSGTSDKHLQMFKDVSGIEVPHFPFILGISKQGRYVEFSGEITQKSLMTFYEALKLT